MAWTGITAANNRDVFFQLFNSNGSQITPAINVTNNSSSHHSMLTSAAINNKGQVVLLWDTTLAQNNNDEIGNQLPYFGRFNATNGSPLDTPIVADADTQYATTPGVGDNPSIGTWNSGTINQTHRSYAVAVDDTGNVIVLTTDTVLQLPHAGLYVHTYNAQDGLAKKWIETESGQEASLAMNAATGNYAISWADGKSHGGYPRLHLQAFDTNGTPSASLQVTTTTSETGSDSNSSVAINSKGQIVLGWLNTDQNNNKSIREQNFSFSGGTLATAHPIATVASVASSVGQLGYTSVALNDSGSYIVGFAYEGAQHSRWTIYTPSSTFGNAPSATSLADTGNAIFGATAYCSTVTNLDHWLAIDNAGHVIYVNLYDGTGGTQVEKTES